MKRIHVYIEGRVQGVFYRAYTRQQALKLKIVGTALNLEDGRVEVIAEGEEKALLTYIEHLRKGPRFSKVEHLDVIWESTTGEYNSFEIA